MYQTCGTENSDHIDISGLDHKYLPANTNPKNFHNGKNLRIRTASEVVLEEQDRKKRRKNFSLMKSALISMLLTE